MRLTQQQQDAVDEPGHVCLVSCPGSGKTRAIVAKLLRCINSVEKTTRRVACITHTNAAADEIDARLRQLCFGDEDNYYEVATIHAFALQNILRPYHQDLPELADGFTVLTSDSEDYVTKARELIGRHRLGARVVEDFERIHRNPDGRTNRLDTLPTALQEEWCRWLDQNAYVTFDDMLYHSGRLVASRPHIASSLASRFAWILVDEFQDSSQGQILVLEHIHSYGRTNFFCVGDPNQSIYRFAGASPELLTNFAARVGANTNHRLTGNFRSSTLIVEVGERLCPTNPPMQAVGEHANCPEEPSHQMVRAPIDGILNEFLPKVRALNIPLGEVAILAPWWQALFHLGRELRRQGIPAIGPGARPYRRSHIVAQLLESLGAYLESPEPAVAVAIQRALFILVSNVTDLAVYDVFSYRGQVVVCKILAEAQQARATSSLAINWIVDVTDRICQILIDADYVAASGVTLIKDSARAMVSDIMDRDGGDTIQTEDMGIFARPANCVQLLTIHKSKGREFDAVAVIDSHDGRLPHFSVERITDPVERRAQYDESRRSVYVATTRARRILMYFTDNTHHLNRPSPFLREMQLA